MVFCEYGDPALLIFCAQRACFLENVGKDKVNVMY